jgi:hypothetical protein
MKKIIMFFSLLLFMFIHYAEAQPPLQTVIGTGTEIPTYTLYSPLYRFGSTSSNRYTASNKIFTASEMSTAGIPAGSIITGIAYFKNGTGGTNGVNNLSMDIYMANTSNTPPLATTTTVGDILASHTLVYSNSSHVIPTVSGWHEITLASPFVYLGGSLEIAVLSEIDGTSPYSTDKFDWVYTTGYADYIVGQFGSSPLTTSSTLSATTSTYKHRPNTRFTYTLPNITNDAGVSSLVAPSPPASPGLQNVEVTITTLAQTDLTSAQINWSVNGSPQTPYSWTGSLSQFDVSAPVTIGTFDFLYGNNTIKVWTSSPNGATDEFNDNDTIEVTMFFANPLSGNYTINSTQPTAGTNFNSFTDFADILQLVGIGGAVTVDVVSGTGPYTEQFILGDILGSSASNTITINGNGETLEFLSTNTSLRGTFILNGTDYVTVDNLIIKALGELTSPVEYGWSVWLTNNADFNTFTNCEFHATTTATSTNFAGFVTSSSATGATTAGLAASNLTVTNCKTIGGYYGMIINGPTSAPYSDNNIISNNEFTDFYAYGLYLRGQNNGLFSDNIISRPSRTNSTTLYMLYITQDMTGSSVLNNIINSFSPAVSITSTAYGIYGTTITSTSGSELLIANNVIYGFGNVNGTQYGMYMLTTDNTRFYHNSISLDNVAHPGSSIIRGFHHSGNLATIDFRNNIISVTSNSTGIKYCMYFSQTAANIPNLTSDNNVLHMGATSGTNHYVYWTGDAGTNYSTLAAWQSAGGNAYDQQSVDADPGFIMPLLTPTSPNVNDIGTNLLSYVSSDIFGIGRTGSPDPGAIEFEPPACAFPTLLNVVSLTANSATLAWTPGDTEDHWDVEVGLPGFTPGTGNEVTGALTTPDNPWIATGLASSTAYEFYVRADCGGTYSPWAGPVSFTTECDAFPIPFLESFNSGNLPICWENTSSSPSGNGLWKFTGTPDYGAIPNGKTAGTYAWSDGSTPNVNDITLITPLIDLTTATHPMLTFEWFSNNTTNPGDNVPLIVDIFDGSSWVTLGTYAGDDPNWQIESISLLSYAGNIVQIRFITDQTIPVTAFYNDILLDEVSIDEAPACPAPVSLTVTNLTDISADLGWTPFGTETEWDVEVGLPGFTPETGSEVTGVSGTPDNPWTATGLTQYTNYEFYVRADCGGSYSSWSGPFPFTTTLPPLSGNYTINSTQPTAGTNFISFTDFATALNLGGVSGAVTVDVVAGTGPYNEQVMINTINNSSSTNTVTINGNGETLQYLSTTSSDRATFKLNAATYMTVDNLIIKALGVLTTTPIEYGWAVWLTNNADYNTFTNCEFHANTTATSTNFAAFVTSSSATGATTAGLAASNLTVTNCKAIGGYYGIIINGPTSGTYADNNIITNNEVTDFHLYGLYLRGQNNGVFSDNIISRPTRTTTGTLYMLYITQDMTGSSVVNNIMNNFSPSVANTSTAYGIYGTTITSTSGSELLIANNVVYGLENMNGTQYGMYMLTTDNTRFYHNSISLDNVSHTGSSIIRGFHHSGNLATIDFRNNIISVTSNSTGVKYCMYFSQATASIPNLTSNNNVLYMGATSGTNYLVYWTGDAGTNYSDLAAWQGAGGGIYDQQSVDADPTFTTPLVTPQNGAVDNIGADLLSIVPVDIFGVSRTTSPDPGAIEFAPATCLAPSGLGAANITAFTADLSWTGPINASSWDIELGLTGFTPTESPTAAGVSNPHIYTGLNPSTTYDFYVRADCGSGDYSLWVGPYTFTTDVTCPDPTNLSTVAVYPFSAEVQWTSIASAFDIEYGVAPYTFTGVANLTGVSNPATISGLTPETNYEYKVKAICGVGDESIWSTETGSFRTTCDYPTITSTTPGSRCGVGTVDLSATASAGTINWYGSLSGGSVLGTGPNFTTPVISSTTSYYVAASSGFSSESAGKPTYIGTDNTSGDQWGLVFDVINNDVTIQSVDVYSVGAGGQMTVELQDNTGALIQSVGPFSYPAGSTSSPVTVTFPLNLTVPVGTGYRLVSASMSGNLIREFSANNTYPYTSASGNVSVTSGFITNPGSTTYYWFYNWQVSSGCESPRTEVIATVNTPPAITASATPSTICLGDDTDLSVSSSNAGYTYEWTGGLMGANHTITPAVSSTYEVTATDISGGPFDGCVATEMVSVTVNPVPSAVSVNPSSAFVGSMTQLTATGGSVGGEYTLGTDITTTSATGITPYSSFYEGARLQYLILASELSALGVVPGNINSLAFDVTSSGAGTQPQINYTMKIAHTNDNAFAGAYGTPSGSWNIVYTNPAEPAPSVGWKTHTFTNPFVWDGVSNILIDICHDNDLNGTCSGCYSSNSAVAYTTTSFNSVYGRYNDNLPACDVIPTTAISTFTNRPNMKFNTESPADITWSPVADLYLDALGNTPYNGEVTDVVYANPPAPVTYTATATNSFGCTSSGTAEFEIEVKSLNVTAFLEGIYDGGGMMRKAQDVDFITWMYVDKFGGDTADVVTLELWTNTGTMVFSDLVGLSTTGSIYVELDPMYTGDYYIYIRHRNSIAVSSANPVSFLAATTTYNFSTAASQAYFDNQQDLGSGVFGLFAGDVDQDGSVGAFDMILVDNASKNFVEGYFPEDVDGDASVGAFDLIFVDNNSRDFVFEYLPF